MSIMTHSTLIYIVIWKILSFEYISEELTVILCQNKLGLIILIEVSYIELRL